MSANLSTYRVVFTPHSDGNVEWVPIGVSLIEELKRRKIKVTEVAESEIIDVLTDINDVLANEGWVISWEEDEDWYQLSYELGIVWMDEEKE